MVDQSDFLRFQVEGYMGVVLQRSGIEWKVSIFDMEKKKAGLEGENILLLAPEDITGYYRINRMFVTGDKSVGYALVDATLVCQDYHRAYRHELDHIRNGDCDRKLPLIIKQLYQWFVEAPRAFFYSIS
ncbi:MAG: hypothetical protein ABIF10_07255 [Candidatus Woesearchaeota archaeon]